MRWPLVGVRALGGALTPSEAHRNQAAPGLGAQSTCPLASCFWARAASPRLNLGRANSWALEASTHRLGAHRLAAATPSAPSRPWGRQGLCAGCLLSPLARTHRRVQLEQLPRG